MNSSPSSFAIGRRPVGGPHPVYFIADISANHDGDLERAKALIHLAARSGADAAKFQNFTAERIVSNQGFVELGHPQSHQAGWTKSVFEVYKDASIPWEWTPVLKSECERAGIEYFSTPYDFGAVDMLDPFVHAYKVGSGDITWPQLVEYIARKGKPVLLATGASDIGDVQHAVLHLRTHCAAIGLLQCNTNYTGSIENFRHIHLNVLETYRTMFPDVVLGLSDHTPGHATVLGAVALGARLIEKHFTDDTTRSGPDHPFSMTPGTWREMVDRCRELELALGSPVKTVAENECETVVLQRRCLRASAPIARGTVLESRHLVALRPAPSGSLPPREEPAVIGMRTTRDLREHEPIRWSNFEPVPS
jgi:N-acetylneuraminate synthase